MDTVPIVDRIVSLILGGLLYAVLLSIPVYVVWLLIKTLNKVPRIEQDVKKLKEEIQALKDKLPNSSPK
jgi:cell division protein FtsB